MKEKHKLKQYNFSATTLQIKRLKEYSGRTGLPISEIIRRALDEYLERRLKDVSNYSDKSIEKEKRKES